MTERGVLLLRAVNVGGANHVPMVELRMLLGERTALTGVSTYIASGNILCDLPDDRANLCAEVRALISERFDVDTPVILRAHSELIALARQNPFTDAPLDKMVHVMFLEDDAAPHAADQLTERLQPGERIALLGRDLWIDYGAGGVAGTKLAKSVLDRALGVAGTARNLRTVRTLADLTAPT